MSAPSLSLTPLSLVPAAGLPSITPSVVVPDTPFASALVPENAAPSVARPLKAASIPESPVLDSDPQPTRELSSENEAANAGASFDGTAVAPTVDPVSPPPASAAPAAPLGSGLRMARSEHEAWLNSVVELLSITRTGRRVLRDIDAFALRRGIPILLDVKPIGNNGEFRYDSDMLIMDSGHLKRDPYQSAPILAHELQHVLQRGLELPVDALELEIESYTVESRVWSELGIEPDANTFARDARKQLRKDFPGFVKWLSEQYKTNIPLYGSTMDAYIEKLEKNLKKAKKSEAQTRKKIRVLERVLDSMRANGMSEDAIAAHHREDVEPLERSLRDGAVNRGWIERDLMRLKEPAIAAQFRAYARGVARRARSLSRP